MRTTIGVLLVACVFVHGTANAADTKKDVFRGKLFPPNVILQHQAELGLSKEQFTEIKAAVVEVQAGVAGHEWDMREAYQSILAELDRSPVDESKVLSLVEKALLAENAVKKAQVAMLIRLRNLLNEEQVAYLETQLAAARDK